MEQEGGGNSLSLFCSLWGNNPRSMDQYFGQPEQQLARFTPWLHTSWIDLSHRCWIDTYHKMDSIVPVLGRFLSYHWMILDNRGFYWMCLMIIRWWASPYDEFEEKGLRQQVQFLCLNMEENLAIRQKSTFLASFFFFLRFGTFLAILGLGQKMLIF